MIIQLEGYFANVALYNRASPLTKATLLYGSIMTAAGVHPEPVVRHLLCRFIDREKTRLIGAA